MALHLVKRRIFYIYNPDTDNFERYFPDFRDRIRSGARFLTVTLLLAVALVMFFFLVFDSPTERHLREENSELQASLEVLGKRLDASLQVMNEIRDRDDNFYRAMMQMEPVDRHTRLAGLGNESRYSRLKRLSDGGLVAELTRELDLFDRQLYAQSLSFDQIARTASSQHDKASRVPSSFPIEQGAFRLASGFGMRRDPLQGFVKFHTGIDFSAPVGTPVMATADGTVSKASRVESLGLVVEINHGFNYYTRFANLDESLVKVGDEVKRGGIIGRVGQSGRSIGPHLHYEVRFNDSAQNPVNYLFGDLSPEQYSALIRMAEDAAQVMD